MFHEPRLLKNKGDCTFWELLYDRLVTLTAIEKCWVLSFKDISTFLSSTGAEVRHVIPSSHFIAVHLICVSHLEVQVKVYSYHCSAETIFSIDHIGKSSYFNSRHEIKFLEITEILSCQTIHSVLNMWAFAPLF